MAKPKKIKLKLKTHKGAQKRFKLTATGKVVRHHAFARHILTSKASKRKRKLGQSVIVSPANAPAIRAMLPYGL
ncbi:MAG: 50S ribosomal protein L35 [Terriglobia bacterium]